MKIYLLKRILLIPVTLLGILLLNFAIVQLAPGGPVEHVMAKYRGLNTDAKSIVTGSGNVSQKYTGNKGVPEELVESLKKQFGFDKPMHIRFLKMIKDYGILNKSLM